jgi:hypothetical protein
MASSGSGGSGGGSGGSSGSGSGSGGSSGGGSGILGALGGLANVHTGDPGMDNFLTGLGSFFNGTLMDMAKPGGLKEGKADEAFVQRSVDRAMSGIDTSKENVLLSIDGTGNHELDPSIAAGVNGDTSVVNVDYQADMNMVDGTATALEATKQLVDKLTAEGKHVSVIGYSQGALAAGKLMADGDYHSKVDHALLVGHPVSDPYQYDNGKDSKVTEFNNVNDVYAGGKDNHALSIMDVIGFNLGGAKRTPGSHTDYDFTDLVRRFLANSFGGGSSGATDASTGSKHTRQSSRTNRSSPSVDA